MSSKKSNELIERYEQMVSGAGSCYFDSDEIDEIADHYESKGQMPKALHAIEFGLKLHPDDVDLRLKQARYLLYLDRDYRSQKDYVGVGRLQSRCHPHTGRAPLP